MLPALGQSFATSAAEAAKTVSAFALAYGLLQLVYGPLGDRFGKPRVVMLAACGCALASVLAALAPTLGLLSLARGLMGAGAAGVIPLTMAWIGDQIPYERRQEVLASLLTYTVLGMMAGAWAGGAIAQVASWRLAFAALAVLFIASALGIARAASGERGFAAERQGLPWLAQASSIFRAHWARTVYGIVFVEGALVFGSLAFIPTALHDRFGLSLVEAGGSVALFGVGGFMYTRLARRLMQSLGVPRLSLCGAIVLSLALATLAATRSVALALPACLLAGLGFYMLHNTLQTCATQLSTTARGTAVSLFACSLFLGQACGVALAAWVVSRVSASAWFGGAGPLLFLLGVYFASRLRLRLTMTRPAAT
jgi:predicted MFS family arabinose efflux permease